MKKNYWMAGALVCALAAATTGCSNEELDGKTPADKGQRTTITASIPQQGANTRVSYDEATDASKVKLAWEAADAIGVWKAGETTVNEFTTASAGASVDFTSTGSVSFSANDQLYAVYPKPSAVAGNEVTLDLSAAQSGEMDDTYHYMYAAAQWTQTGTANFSFKHAVSVLKLTLDFSGIGASAPASLTGVTLSATGLHNKATLTMSGTPAVTGTDAGDITASGTFDVSKPVCLYIFPELLSDIKITATDGTKTYEGTLTNSTAVAGKVYTATVAMAKKEASITWATGNLVYDASTDGCKVGAPTDGGLYFQFGSLVGWSGSANADGTGTGGNTALSIVVKPTNFDNSGGKNAWTSTGKIWQGTTGSVPFTVAGSGSADEIAGIGDPCRYYLGGTWRLPTNDEYVALFKNHSYPSTGPWTWNGTLKSAINSELSLAFPALGYRHEIDGRLGNVGSFGYYWSASPAVSDYCYSLNFDSFNVYPSNYESRASGLSVRCVQEQ